MPILDGRDNGDNLRTINVYQEDYTGQNFVAYLKVQDVGGLAPQNGRFSFAVQQESLNHRRSGEIPTGLRRLRQTSHLK
ncbi:hypothetical protein D0856_07875 [Vibrio owensii]|nr:hypothetical protein D0856_07875 [Vibrio owensii]